MAIVRAMMKLFDRKRALSFAAQVDALAKRKRRRA
jgi:hypothetical protein